MKAQVYDPTVNYSALSAELRMQNAALAALLCTLTTEYQQLRRRVLTGRVGRKLRNRKARLP